LRGQKTLNLRAGTTEYGGVTPVPPNSLWQIGSNTKAFTAAIILQLEAEHVLSIQDTLGTWLPQYPAWSDITIKQLLNMTSGVASYDEQPAFLADYAAAPTSDFTLARLVSYAEGIPLQAGWNYSNTGYQLAQMIIEKATNDTYKNQLTKRFFIPLDLRNMFYRPDFYSAAVTERVPAGYFFDGTIPQATLADPYGFGLGVQQQNSFSSGTIWDYEGGTFGYRMLHIYLPGPSAVITVGLNSNPPSGDDQIGALGASVYATLQNAGRL